MSKVIDINEMKSKSKEENSDIEVSSDVNLDEPVTRRELMEIMKQVVENINTISDYLMKDVNTMYAQHVFPFQIRQAALEDVLVSRKTITIEEVDKSAEDRVKKLEEQAKEIKENESSEQKDIKLN